MQAGQRLSKAEAQQVHARERFRRRKNINFTEEHQEAVDMIRNHHPCARFVQKRSQRVSIWDIVIAGADCRVVYDRKRGNIVTVLPERWNADYVQRLVGELILVPERSRRMLRSHLIEPRSGSNRMRLARHFGQTNYEITDHRNH